MDFQGVPTVIHMSYENECDTHQGYGSREGGTAAVGGGSVARGVRTGTDTGTAAGRLETFAGSGACFRAEIARSRNTARDAEEEGDLRAWAGAWVPLRAVWGVG